ncbi:MAG: glutamine-hydrolyzing carbamoyl-phosphate synthase small subunit [Firmicutes bacterium]|nr:glutamine-hydrolyzing carbamoyl-phosphate synthase small subunit [Bacillota bacterium]
MEATLILENGKIFKGNAFGYLKESVGEVVFNTGMTGYQEVLTDPSYYGQIVTMTYPLVGNYGINLEDMESDSPKVKGFIVREQSDKPNNFRCEMKLNGYLRQNKIIGLEGIDTRALTKILRNHGTMKGIITLRDLSESQINHKFDAFHNKNAVDNVTTKEVYEIEGNNKHIAILDFGIKKNIIRSFKKRNCKMTIFPANSKPKDILDKKPDAIFLSNGPGDPEDLPEVVENLKQLVDKKPILGICLGHQLLALCFGGTIKKLKYGHRGWNHPVKDLDTNKIYITSQNHGYYVDKLPEEMIKTHLSLNDNTIEGMKHKKLPIYSVQFHPEACPGPKDMDYIFDQFVKMAK